MELGILKEINIRKVWAHEQYDFSEWLSKEDNIQQLGNTLNLSLTDVETEKFVGSYRCDIICKDEITGKNVLIENQLEPSNHDHLGKIITYASGLDASVIIWIVESAKEEHSSAIEWLNKHTDDEVSFFLIEVHAYTIEGSKPAPFFKIIQQPNDFVKQVKNITKNTELNDSQNSRLEFWNRFNDVLEKRGKPFNKRKATTDHWYSVAVGSSQCHISIDLVNREHKIRISMWIPDNKQLYDIFYSNKEAIEKEIGHSISWDKLDDKKAAYAYTFIEGLDFNNQNNYDKLMNSSINEVLLFRKAFKPYII
ncbi:MAG: DUF4268 domain-containing protein [Bacteroidales bacterium]|jgi:hypothetical protein|nr:DUF4268 domain-containing protein [Bacteroidales bacterium]